ncbi:MAG TPA: hypothetical protein VJS65_12970, partial [Verrucomicrobiae bacterium]|nr:hypothetical protein [Verrucomicrobiae bacterium]
MNSQSATFFRFAFTIAAGLVFASSGWAVNLVYFRNTSPRGLYDFDTDTQQSTLRVSVPSASLPSLAVRPSDGTVFGIDGDKKLVRLDVNTGLTTVIGNLYSNSTDLAIQPGTGALW